jgi:conjugal transfer pilus assembly protein TraW
MRNTLMQKAFKQKYGLFRALLFCFLWAAHDVTDAKNLGVQGTVFSIEETSLLDVIQQRLLEWQKTGELVQKRNALKERIEHSLRHLPAIQSLTPATQTRVRFFDPRVVVTRLLTDEAGNILAIPGDVIDPLETFSISAPLIFIDPSREAEWRWLKKHERTCKDTAMIILVGGDAINAMEQLGRRVYYDTKGRLAKRLSLTHTPTIVTQEKKQLRLEEISL